MTTAQPADRSDHVLRRFLLAALWLPVALVALGVAVQLVLLPQMPETIAIHWNGAGVADGFAPAWTQPLMTVVFGLGIPALIAFTSLPGLRRGERGATYRLMGATAAATSALMTVLFTWTFVAQVDGAVPAVWPALIASFGTAIVVGVIAWFVQPNEAWHTSHPQPAAPLDIADDERVAWLRTASMAPAAAIGITVAVLGVVACTIGAWVAGADVAIVWALIAVTAVTLSLAAATVAFHVRVDGGGLRVTSVLGIPRFHDPLSDVESAARVEVNPMGEFGGWGLRLSTGRRFGVVLRSGEAIEVLRRSGKRFVVTVDDAATGAALLEALVARAAARP